MLLVIFLGIALLVSNPILGLVYVVGAMWIYHNNNKFEKSQEEKRENRYKKIQNLLSEIKKGNTLAAFKLADEYDDRRNGLLVPDDAYQYYLKAAQLEYNLREKQKGMLTDSQFSIACKVVGVNSYKFEDEDRVEKLGKRLFWLNQSYSAGTDSEILKAINDTKSEIESIKNERLRIIREEEEREREEERLKKQWSPSFLQKLSKDNLFNKAQMIPYKKFFENCDSEPEIILLEKLILELGLKVSGENLTNGKLRLSNQVEISWYRIDFLLNDLVIEVDGRSYHENDHSFERDRIRDQELMTFGYKTVRYTASQIYRDCPQVVQNILDILHAA